MLNPGPSIIILEFNQHLARLYSISRSHIDLFDDPSSRSTENVLHLHRLHHRQFFAHSNLQKCQQLVTHGRCLFSCTWSPSLTATLTIRPGIGLWIHLLSSSFAFGFMCRESCCCVLLRTATLYYNDSEMTFLFCTFLLTLLPWYCTLNPKSSTSRYWITSPDPSGRDIRDNKPSKGQCISKVPANPGSVTFFDQKKRD